MVKMTLAVTDIVNCKDWKGLREQFLSNVPFNHVLIDDFFVPQIAEQLAAEFPQYDSDVWNAHYNNPLENKKACNHWDKFPPTTYNSFSYLCSKSFTNIISTITGNSDINADIGLHGGGLHAHTTNGKLNVHLDYSIHPKLKLQRKYNLIVYITPQWQPQWNGGLEFWNHDECSNQPSNFSKLIVNKFNRAVLFDTTQNSWHGLSANLSCPENITRSSMAVYYVTTPSHNTDPRGKALFAPTLEQSNNIDILELIQKRSNAETASQVYKTNSK